jgi:membrane-associated phospholipid phosphatase
MKAWKVFIAGALIFMLTGIMLTFAGDKGHFLKWLAMYRTPVADYFFYHVTKLGEEIGFIVIGIMLWLMSWRKMVFIPILGGVVTLLTYVLKELFQYERPRIYLDRIGWDGPMAVLDYALLSGHSSFPSGHSMAAWALFTFTASMIRKTWVSVLCLFLAASVSISRVYLMAHFLRDVLAGAALGFALGYMAFYFFDKWMKQRELVSNLKPPGPES